jgi:MarR family transcriptional regulator, lower aerobic nicotinate degradation pathway regulator
MGSHTSRESVRSILDDIRRIVQALRVSSRHAEKSVGLSGAQLFVLQKLDGSRALSINELAAITHTHQSSVSVVAQRLLALKLVSVAKSPEDGRRVELSLTPRGRRILKRSPGAAQDRLIAALRRFPPAKATTLATLLQQVVRDTGIADQLPSMFFEDKTPRSKGRQKTNGRSRSTARVHH